MKKAALLTAITALAVALVAYLSDVLPSDPTTTPPAVVVVDTPAIDTTPVVAPPPSTTTPILTLTPTGTSATAYLKGLGSYTELQNPSLLSIDTTVRYNGRATLRYTQPANTDSTPQLWVYFPGGVAYTHLWIRMPVRYSPSWTTIGTTSGSANAYKILGWGWRGADGRGTLEFTNTSQYTFNYTVTRDDRTLVGPTVEFNGPNATTEWTGAAWVVYVVHLETLSSTQIRETWYRDGVRQATITGTMTKGMQPPIDRLGIGMNFNSKRTRAQYLNVGPVEVVDGSTSRNPFSLSE